MLRARESCLRPTCAGDRSLRNTTSITGSTCTGLRPAPRFFLRNGFTGTAQSRFGSVELPVRVLARLRFSPRACEHLDPATLEMAWLRSPKALGWTGSDAYPGYQSYTEHLRCMAYSGRLHAFFWMRVVTTCVVAGSLC